MRSRRVVVLRDLSRRHARLWPLAYLPLAGLRLASLPFAPFNLPFSFFNFALALASFSASRFALRSILFFSRSRSARASARFFLRFFSQAPHLQPIGLR